MFVDQFVSPKRLIVYHALYTSCSFKIELTIFIFREHNGRGDAVNNTGVSVRI